MRLVLHAGQHKTGSTAIQDILRRHAADLARDGVFVPRVGMGPGGNHRPWINALLLDPQGALAERAAAEWRKATAGFALASSEWVKGLLVRGKGAALLAALRRIGVSRLTVVLYLRGPFELANASFCQRTAALTAAGRDFATDSVQLAAGDYFAYQQILDFARLPGVTLRVYPYAGAARENAVRHLFG